MGSTESFQLDSGIYLNIINKGPFYEAEQDMSRLSGIFSELIVYGGIILLVFGLYRLILSFRDESRSAVAPAVIICVIAAVMIASKGILSLIFGGISAGDIIAG